MVSVVCVVSCSTVYTICGEEYQPGTVVDFVCLFVVNGSKVWMGFRQGLNILHYILKKVCHLELVSLHYGLFVIASIISE